ncbi:ABC transporter permease [[Clostridium] sordellii]|uniref:ABC transporter permease protein n=1 Tax=Paraclostridium sordellii TaxID=1505 RepID=A0ABM9RME1_PARSO|nr:ABC transporter permease [Paeniclostridium sordellii]CEJ73192.1 putative ABC transporter permease protein [[Clostridium] sordellii] [Paeniclostridium sordellii]CEN68745.1 ABC transporter permease [[Clostridium] sordellii] [Paeniclostridium sordellii]CEN72012.1 ABC transporter permease [[Clostridium] sordellii] [Paeniclostridium sordellii]CEO22919.1 ABC transporter permease [[Clostridium] sordellii] [Paeniclostridium sordellii]CEP76395.1 ABC transporter permease [[Clostridium] sordellii] [Pa
MYSLKMIIKDLIKNKLRNSLNIIIMIIIISSVLISEIVNVSTNIILSSYKKKFESEVQIIVDQEKLTDSSFNKLLSQSKWITSKEYLNFSKSKYVKKAFFTGNMAVNIEELNFKKDNINQRIEYDVKQPSSDLIKRKIQSQDETLDISNDTSFINGFVRGYSNDYKDMIPNINIKNGSMFKNDNECIVSESFLKENKFKLGDKITISNGKDNEKLVLKIVGSYEKSNKNFNENEITALDTGINNEVITTYNTLANYDNNLKSPYPLVYTNAKFILNSYKDRSKFEKELREKGLSNLYKFAIDENTYRKVIEPIEYVHNISFIFTLGALILGALILFIISMLSTNNIKYDIGVFRNFGIPKLKIAKKFLYQSILMTFICLVIGSGICVVSVKPVSNYIYEYQNHVDKNIDITLDKSVVYKDLNNTDTKKEIDSIKVKIDKDFISKIIILSILLSLLTSIVAIYNTIIYKPIEIIDDRN